MVRLRVIFTLIIILLGLRQDLRATKLVEMQVVDKDYLAVHFIDGIVVFVDDAKGPRAYTDQIDAADNRAVYYGKALDVTKVSDIRNWTIKSADDAAYGATGLYPTAVFRKTSVNGMSQEQWGSNDWNFDYTLEHFIYLRLPSSLQQKKSYTVEINPVVNADTSSQSITYNIFTCPSEAIHTNLVGYMSGSRIKAADLYQFLGDGGSRDYSSFVGNKVHIYNVQTGESQVVGSVVFWMKAKRESQHNLTGSDVWNVDFTGFRQTGIFRLAVEGVGCSQDFEIRDDIYHDPFKVNVLGYFYMRIGQDNLNMTPVPRRPLYIQDRDPANCKIYVTSMHPFHAQWQSFASGDKWDRPTNWAPYKKPGNPTNPRAVGGHSDALDWDRHLAHVVDIYDLCLGYLLSDGALSDDDLGIAESGNGIPDLLDEARNEVDFWLNLRYQGGYSHGITNPDANNALYQADNTALAAWANALNSAMLAACFQIAGQNDLKQAYLDSALNAFRYADALPDPMLDRAEEGIRGVDFKMMAAAFLYDITGDTRYEDLMKNTCMITSGSTAIYQQGSYNQLWGVAAYLKTTRAVHYPELRVMMKSAVMADARLREAERWRERPSRRGYSDEQAWWQTNQDMPRTVLAHSVSDNPTDRMTFWDALLLEADWGLGRNPVNMMQMTTATTELAAKRSVENCYTSGRNDGAPGLHPGHTPYLNTESWGGEMAGSNPGKVLAKFYPPISQWPHAAKYINTRYMWAHSEFTPRQTMRGKLLLYAYLYSLSKSGGAVQPVLIADAGPDQRIVDEDNDGKAQVVLDGSQSFSSDGDSIRFQWRLNNVVIDSAKTVTVELNHGVFEFILQITDSRNHSAQDTVKIEIVSALSGKEPDYGFETSAQYRDWLAENFSTVGGAPVAGHSMERPRNGKYSFKITANFTAGSEHALRRNHSLPVGVTSLIYHVWVPKILVDSAKAVQARDPARVGGIQNYLMHNGWKWVSRWFSMSDLKGDDWNELELVIPDGVLYSQVQAFGVSFKMLDINAGSISVYIDDIYFVKKSTLVEDAFVATLAIPGDFKLYNNHPNPFNPSTMIRYDLPRSAPVKIVVYDVIGRTVQTLVNEFKNAGSHETVFDGASVAGGVYLYNLEADAFRDTKKMILIK